MKKGKADEKGRNDLIKNVIVMSSDVKVEKTA